MARVVVRPPRGGAVVPFTAILLVFLLAMVAFAVDTGYLLVVRNEAQNAADAAALAGVGKIAELLKSVPVKPGVTLQTTDDLKLAGEEARLFAGKHLVGRVAADAKNAYDGTTTDPDGQNLDIEMGYMADPYNHGSDTLDKTGWPARPYNAVRVTVRRDRDHAGGPLRLFFAPILGITHQEVGATATAVLVMGTATPKGNQDGYSGGLLPFTYNVDNWDAVYKYASAQDLAKGWVKAAVGFANDKVDFEDAFKVDPQGNSAEGVATNTQDGTMELTLYPNRTAPGNWGTINFSKSQISNSTSVLEDLIRLGPHAGDGPDQDSAPDWPDLPDILKANESPLGGVFVNGDPGISAGLKDAVNDIIGQPRILPLYRLEMGPGNNHFYQLVRFVPVTIVDINLNGSENNKYIKIQPRRIAERGLVDGTTQLDLDITPNDNPDPLVLGGRGLVR